MLNFRGKAIIISTIVALSIIPTESIIINRFMTVNSLGMLNTYIGLAIPSVAYPMYMYLYYNHFKGMPKELQEAAIIDGASYWKIFTKIMMPLSNHCCDHGIHPFLERSAVAHTGYQRRYLQNTAAGFKIIVFRHLY